MKKITTRLFFLENNQYLCSVRWRVDYMPFTMIKTKKMDIFILTPATANPDLLSAKVNKIYNENKPMLHLEVDKLSETIVYLRQVAIRYNLHRKTQDALIRAYYLYYFLIRWAELGEGLVTNDIEIALGINNETRIKINNILRADKLLTIYMKKHYESIENMLRMDKYGLSAQIDPYSYDFSIYGGINDQHKVASEKMSYPLPRKLWEKIVKKGFALSDNSFLMHALDKECDTKLTQPTYSLLDESIYVPPYNRIRISPILLSMRVKDAKKKTKLADAISWISEKNNPVKYTSGRLYHAFHRTSRTFRKYLEYNGSLLVEAMDIHNAFFLLLSKILHVAERVDGFHIDQEELNKYDKLIREGRLYEDVMLFEKYPIRDQIKERMNTFKNDTKASMAHYPEYNYFKERFPSILHALQEYPTYNKKDGTKTKYIQTDLSFIETFLISSVCWKLKEQGITPFSLHDAIYVSQSDLDRLQEKDIDINNIFWDKFDSLTDDEIIALIKESRSCRS